MILEAGMRAGRQFGRLRPVPCGSWRPVVTRVRYYGPDGRRHSAPRTFERKSDATKCLALVEAKITREEWADPDRGRVFLGDYADKWIVTGQVLVLGVVS